MLRAYVIGIALLVRTLCVWLTIGSAGGIALAVLGQLIMNAGG